MSYSYAVMLIGPSPRIKRHEGPDWNIYSNPAQLHSYYMQIICKMSFNDLSTGLRKPPSLRLAFNKRSPMPLNVFL